LIFNAKNKSNAGLLLCLFFTSIFSSYANAQSSTPRYVAGVLRLADSHHYIQKNKAVVYWQLSPYYLPQLTGSSCSLASTTMIVNAARSRIPLPANQPLATQDELLHRVNNANWITGVAQGGNGATLDELAKLIPQAMNAYGVNHCRVEVTHLSSTSKKQRLQLHQALLHMERSGKTFMIANFNQKFFTGATSSGHFAPVGAYDPINKSVLIMDPDREFYEPYWVPESLFFKSMATLDKESGQSRGYLLITVENPPHQRLN